MGEQTGVSAALSAADDSRIIDPPTRAYIHILRGLGLQQQEIADEIGDLSKWAVMKTLHNTKARVQNGEDPIEVWMDVVEPLYANDPDGGDA